MTEILGIATVWLGLAVFSTILANHLRVSMALMEICVGVAAGAVAGHYLGDGALRADAEWLRFLAPFLGCAALARFLSSRWRPRPRPSGSRGMHDTFRTGRAAASRR